MKYKKLLCVISAVLFAASSLPVYAMPEGDSIENQIDEAFENTSDTEILNDVSNIQDDTSDFLQRYEQHKVQYYLGNEACPYSESVKNDWDREWQLLRFGMDSTDVIRNIIPKTEQKDGTIYEYLTFSYTEAGSNEENTSEFGYIFNLQNNPVAVSNTESNYRELQNEGVIITAEGVTIANTADDEEVPESFPTSPPSLPSASSWNYDVSKAAAYADKWAMSRNPVYTWWGDDGGDCANFASQCLYAGGMPKTSKWKPNAAAWIGQNDLREYLVSIKAGTLLTHPKSKDLKAGDLVWYNWDGKGSRTNHVTICVGKNSSGTPLIDSHTNARKHYKWNYGRSGTTYMAMQMKTSSSTSDKSSSESSTGSSSGSSASYGNVYRLYNPNTGEHFYTSGARERDGLVKLGWKYEGIGWKANKRKNGNPIYRLYNPYNGDHHYTTSLKERNNLKEVGWKYENVLCYVPSSGTAVYRLYNPNAKKAGAHHYTKKKTERDALKKFGWKYEGIAWYSKE